jgi:hypothetical protein
MKNKCIFILLIGFVLIQGCMSYGPGTAFQYPWREANPGEDQDWVNQELSEGTTYSGMIHLDPRSPRFDRKKNPQKAEYEILLRGWVDREGEDSLKRKFKILAHSPDVVERNGDESGAKLVIEDQLDRERWTIYVTYQSEENSVFLDRVEVSYPAMAIVKGNLEPLLAFNARDICKEPVQSQNNLHLVFAHREIHI